MKRIVALAMCAASLGAAAQLPDYVPTDGLVAWFDMEGELLNELSGELGTLTNTANTSDRYGNEGMAIEFSGNAFGVTSGSNMPTGALSVASWILPQTSWSQGAGIEFLCLGTSGSTKWGTIVGSEFALLNRGRGCGGGGQVLQNPGIELNQWNHVVFSCAGPGLATEVYLNGSLIGLSQNINPGSNCSASNLYFGVDIFSQPEYISGALDDIGIWNRAITEEEVLALYNAAAPITGCTDASACNFDEEATLDDGSCVSCDLVASFCGLGTIWDPNTQTCIGDGSGDINLDGCVQLNDLLDLLSAYGDCGAEESAWQCGDPLEYQGYDYETVQFGEQCWFAENLRAEKYRNGDIIPDGFSASQWSALSEGARAVYGNNDANLLDFGYMFNWRSTVDERGLCPSGWHVPSHQDHLELVSALNQINEGCALVTAEVGLGMKYGGYRKRDGSFTNLNVAGYYWSTSPETEGKSWGFAVYPTQCNGATTLTNEMFTWGHWIEEGFSVRCIKDAE